MTAKYYRYTLLMILPLIIFVVALSTASAEDTTCYLKATIDDISVYVYEFESGSTVEKHLFKGIIKDGDKHLIESKTGKIVYSYQVVGEDRSYGDNHARCANKNWIDIP